MALPEPVQIAEAMPGPEHRDPEGCCWWGQPGFVRDGQWYSPCWFYGEKPDAKDTHWVAAGDLPLLTVPEPEPDDEDDWLTHPSLTVNERNLSLCR